MQPASLFLQNEQFDSLYGVFQQRQFLWDKFVFFYATGVDIASILQFLSSKSEPF